MSDQYALDSPASELTPNEASPAAQPEVDVHVTDPAPPSSPQPASGWIPELNEPVVEVSRAAVGLVRARDVQVRQGSVGGVVAGTVSVEMGGAGGILARQASLRLGGVSTVIAADAHVSQSFVRTMIANTVHVGPSTGILLVVARRVDGGGRVLLDWRGALALGGVLAALVLVGRRPRA